MLLTRLALFLRLVLTPVRVVIAFVEALFERYGMIPTRLALRVRIITLILLLALIVGGIWSYTRLQVEYLPSVDFPLVTVVTFYPGAGPDTVLEDVTIPIEKILQEQEDVKLVQSTSSLNLSVVSAEFAFGTDTAAIEDIVQGQVDQLQLPPPVGTPNVGRLNFEQFPVLQVSARSNLPPEELQTVVERDILPRLREVPGVDSADIPANAGGQGVISRTNGQPSLTINVVKGADNNTVEVVNAALAELDDIKAGLPADIQFTEISNQGPEIQDSIDTLGREVALGAVLAILVILGFLLSVRPTFVTGISIPASLLAGIIVMNLQGMSLNVVTLGALAIAAGRVVDDSIVVMENIYRHIQDGEERLHAAFEGTKEVALPITIATMTTIAVFAPLGFIGGIVSEFFLPFALVITYALLASLLVALTAVPVLASLLIKRHATDTAEEVLSRRIIRIYTPLITWALGHRLYTILGAILLFAGSMSLLANIPIGFLPGSVQNVLSIEIDTPPTTSPNVIAGYLDEAEAQLEELRLAGDVEAYTSQVGGGFGFGGPGGGLTTINMSARLAEDVDALAMSDRLQEAFSGPDRTVFIEQAQGGGPPAGGLEIRLISEDYLRLIEASDRLIGPVAELDGVINVRSDAIEVSGSNPLGAAFIPITRVDGRRTVTISGVITAQDTRAVSAEIDRIVDEVGLPPGVERETGGVFSDIQEVFTQMVIAMGIGAVLVYAVMFVAQRSFITPMIILIAVPLAFTGAVTALFLTGRALSLPGLMGLLMLIGLVVTNAVVLIAFVDQVRGRGARIRDALIQGGQARIRPILMTALTTSFVLLPLALEEGQSSGIIGAELATVIIGGLMTSTVLTLVVIPVVYRLLRREDRELPDTPLTGRPSVAPAGGGE